MRAPKPLLMPEAAAPAAGTSTTPPADSMADFRKLLGEFTSSAAGGASLTERETKLLRENYKARDKVRELTGQLEDAKKKQVAEGATVLVGDDAKEYAEFKKLGVPTKDLTAKLAERDTLAADKTARDAKALVATVAETLGIANVRAFQRLVAAEGLTVTMKTVKVKDEDTGKMVEEQVPVARKRGADEKAEPEDLAELLERDYAEDLDTLLTAGASGSVGGDGGEAEDASRTAPARRRTLGEARESAQTDTGTAGTRFPRTSSRAPTGAGSARKRDEEAIDRKVSSGAYAL